MREELFERKKIKLSKSLCSSKVNVPTQRITTSDPKITCTVDLSHVTWVIHCKIGSKGRVGGVKTRGYR